MFIVSPVSNLSCIYQKKNIFPPYLDHDTPGPDLKSNWSIEKIFGLHWMLSVHGPVFQCFTDPTLDKNKNVLVFHPLSHNLDTIREANEVINSIFYDIDQTLSKHALSTKIIHMYKILGGLLNIAYLHKLCNDCEL